MTYEVGYKRPPKETRFQKGKSGNPKGRRRTMPFEAATALTRFMEERIEFLDRAGRRTATRKELSVRRLFKHALEGDVPSMDLLLDLHRHAHRLHDTDEIVIKVIGGLPIDDQNELIGEERKQIVADPKKQSGST